MKNFLKNLSLAVDVRLHFPPLTYKINAHNKSDVRSSAVIIFEGLHTYIIGHYNPSVRIINLVSHTIYVVCVNFIRE